MGTRDFGVFVWKANLLFLPSLRSKPSWPWCLLNSVDTVQYPRNPGVKDRNPSLTFSTDAVILLWKVNDNKEPEQIALQDEDEAQLNKENWTVVKTLR